MLTLWISEKLLFRADRELNATFKPKTLFAIFENSLEKKSVWLGASERSEHMGNQNVTSPLIGHCKNFCFK